MRAGQCRIHAVIALPKAMHAGTKEGKKAERSGRAGVGIAYICKSTSRMPCPSRTWVRDFR